MKKSISIFPFALFFTLFAFNAFAGTEETRALWNHHSKAWEERNLDEFITEYTDDTLVIFNGQQFLGKEGAQRLFSKLFTFFNQASEHQMDFKIVKGNMIFIMWHAIINEKKYTGTDTFFVGDGKVKYQTIVFDPDLHAKFLN